MTRRLPRNLLRYQFSAYQTSSLWAALLLLAATCLTEAPPAVAAEQPAAEAGQMEQMVDLKVPVEMRFLLALPADYEQDKQKKWPLMLFLHGAGERGDNLDRVKIHGPPMQIAAGKKFPMIVASPQCPAGKRWQAVTLLALIDHLAAKYQVDEDRIYVTGLSMGGFGTWSLAAYAPDRLAAIAPICGGGERYWAADVKHLPIWAFHGEKDTAVPVERSQSMIDAITRAGGSPKLTVYPGVGHNSWKATYDNPAVYTWLLSQKRGQPAADPAAPQGD